MQPQNYDAVRMVTTRNGWNYRVVEGTFKIGWFDGDQHFEFRAYGKEPDTEDYVSILPTEVVSIIERAAK